MKKGAFTGAIQRRLGRFELDTAERSSWTRVGDIIRHTGGIASRAQENEFERDGGTRADPVDVRVIAARIVI